MKRRIVLGTVMAVGALTVTVAALQQPAGPPAPMVIEVDKLKDNVYVMPAKYTGYGMPNPMFVRSDAQVIFEETK